MPIIVRMERLQRGCWVRVAILCMLFGLWSFIPLASAEMPETFCQLDGLAVAAMAATPEVVDGVVAIMPADDVLTTVVSPDIGPVTASEADLADAVAPLPGILVAGGGPPRPPNPLPVCGTPGAPTRPPGCRPPSPSR
jgi:hypothetical protein